MSSVGGPPLATGPFYEDFSPGQRFTHSGRTITQTDNAWLTLLTNNNNPIHLDERYARASKYGRLVVNSALTLALATGLSVSEISRNGINLGWDNVRLPHPMFPGDTLWCESEVLSCRISESRPDAGIVRVRTSGRNQDGVVVITFQRAILIPTRRDQETS